VAVLGVFWLALLPRRTFCAGERQRRGENQSRREIRIFPLPALKAERASDAVSACTLVTENRGVAIDKYTCDKFD
jgi:hypothetical protein